MKIDFKDKNEPDRRLVGRQAAVCHRDIVRWLNLACLNHLLPESSLLRQVIHARLDRYSQEKEATAYSKEGSSVANVVQPLVVHSNYDRYEPHVEQNNPIPKTGGGGQVAPHQLVRQQEPDLPSLLGQVAHHFRQHCLSFKARMCET